MSTLVPRPPYSKDELEKLYPPGLELMLSQIFLRHGERSPISARFQNVSKAHPLSRKQGEIRYWDSTIIPNQTAMGCII